METTVKEARQCPSCGKPMPAGALAGLCPVCLLAQGADTDSGDGGSGARFEPLPLAEVAKLFPQLEILGLLGAGGMGAVYKARQPALDRIVALKILPSQNARGVNFAERFNREARALARLSHPNIVAVHEFGQAGALSYFIMEFVDGANLRLLEQGSRLSPREALQIIPQICDALQYAHDEGVVHRDIKPENVLVDRKGRVKIADFGLAKILGVDVEAMRLTAEGQVMGTPHYMAPEQIEKPLSVDHRADIYALGVVLYEMLTGDLPLGKFSSPSSKVQVDVRFDEVVLRALENDPARRYQKASEVKTQMETIAGTPTSASSVPATPGSGSPESGARVARWAGFPLVVERDGARQVNWKEAALAWAILLGLLTIAFAFVSAVTGRSLMGWLGVVGLPSVVARIALATVLVGWGLCLAWMHPWEERFLRTAKGTAILSPRTPWWRSRPTVLTSLVLLLVTWTVFQEAVPINLLKRTLNSTKPVAVSVPAPGEPTAQPASAELWSPTLGPGEKPDPDKVFGEAKELKERGDYEQALQRHLWYHNHALEFDRALTGVRLSFALFDWLELSRRYPKAKEAMIEVRDRKARELAEGRGHSDLFHDVAAINRCLQADGETCALFKRIDKADPALAQRCLYFAKDALVKCREYQLYSSYIPDAQVEFELLREMQQFNQERARKNPQLETPDSVKEMDGRFVEQVSQLIEILAGAGREAEAEKIRTQAATLVDDPRFKSSQASAALNSSNPGAGATLDELPPVIIRTLPIAGARDVEPGATEIRATFNKDMTDGSWSWSEAWTGSTPSRLDEPRFEADHRTCAIKVKLEPGRTYAWWLNSDQFRNFKDKSGRASVPYLLIFQTKQN